MKGEKQSNTINQDIKFTKAGTDAFSEENVHASNSSDVYSCLQQKIHNLTKAYIFTTSFNSGPSISYHTDLWTFTSTIQHHSNNNSGRPCLKAPS
jgi:hypothetical protein